VTFAAFRFSVFALERVIRQLVVKLLFIQHDYPGLAPLVFRMAGTAGLLLDPPVITLLLRHVLSDVLVAVPAQPVLPFPLETNVAVRTLPFRLGMALDDLARHQHAFQRLRLRLAEAQACRQPRQQQEQRNKNRLDGNHVIVLKSFFSPVASPSIHMHGDNMCDRTEHHHVNEWHVEDVP
jgi:hypothetical protein